MFWKIIAETDSKSTCLNTKHNQIKILSLQRFANQWMKFNTLYKIGNEMWIINSLGGFRVEIYRLNTKSCYKQFNMPMHYVKGQYICE